MIIERQRHRVALLKFCQPRRRSLTRKNKLSRRGVDPLNLSWRKSINDELSKGAVAAADVDPAQTAWQR